jgi:cholera toxin transcriptional activator
MILFFSQITMQTSTSAMFTFRVTNMSDTGPTAPLLPPYQIRTHKANTVFSFDPTTHRLTTNINTATESVELGFAQSRILELLICRADAIVTRNEIFEFAWHDRVVGQNSLNQAIASLRQLLGDEEKRQMIQTIPRHGYRLSSAFISAAAELPGSESVEPDIEPDIAPIVAPIAVAQEKPAAHFWLSNARWLRMGLCALVVLLTLSLLWRIDWGLLVQSGMVTLSRQVGEQQQLFVAADQQALSALQNEVSSVSQRLGDVITTPTAVIFTKMHSYYSFVCVNDGGASEFILVHRSKLHELTDMQLQACLK